MNLNGRSCNLIDACNCGGPGSNPGQSLWVCGGLALKWFPSENLWIFLWQLSFYQGLHVTLHVSTTNAIQTLIYNTVK